MKFGLFGYPNSGRKTLFELLTGEQLAARWPSIKNEGAPGMVPIRDQRLEELAKLYRPKKVTPAVLEFFLAPEIQSPDPAQGAWEPIFRSLERMDVLGLMVRSFEDDSIFHVRGNVNPLRDIEEWTGELLLRDHLFVEKRIERLEKDLRTKRMPEKEKELDLFQRLLQHLEEEMPLRMISLSAEQDKLLRNYPLLTRKPLLILLNVGEDQMAEEIDPVFMERFGKTGTELISLSVKIELELNALSPDERVPFLKELGLRTSALEMLTQRVYSLLGLITYFTVGEDEVRSWTVPRNSTAPRAARAIHADMEKGFIRAELMKYQDLISLGSEQKVKNAGLLQLKGKDYIVQDGDILSFRFNV